MLQNYLKITFRNLWKYKTFSTINLLGLTVGLASFMLIALWVKDETSYDRFHEFAPRLYRVMMNASFSDGSIATQSATPGLLGQALRDEVPELAYATTMDSWTNTLVGYENQMVKEEGRYVEPDFLKMFSFPLLKGDKETALSSPNGIVISQRLADKLFPGAEAMGKVLKIANFSEYTVMGVMQNLPKNSIFNFEFLLPFSAFLQNNEWAKAWENNGLETFVMLDEGTDFQTVNDKIKDVVKNHGDQDNAELFLQPLTDVYLKSDYENGVYSGGGRMANVRLFGIIALLILLIACINFMNLSTARAAVRAKEVGVRKVIGAGRLVLTFQFIGEALLMCLMAAGAALAVVDLVLPWFNNFTEKQIHVPYHAPLSWAVLGSIVLLSGLLAGSYPAFVLSAFRPMLVLKKQMEKTQKGVLMRKVLVVGQFSVAVFLIAGMVIVKQQLDYLQTENLGYKKEQLLYVSMNNEQVQQYKNIKLELQQLPGVASVSASGQRLTGYGNSSNSFAWEGKSEDDDRMVVFQPVQKDYLKTIGAELLEGRDFSEEYGTDTSNVVLNESAVKMMGLKPPYIGQRFETWGNPGQIIGIVKDYNFYNLKYDIEPLILVNSSPHTYTMYLRMNGQNTPETLKNIEKVCKKYSPAFPFEYAFADEAYNKLYKNEQVLSQLSSIFAFLAIFISCLGLFGLATFTAERRTKEIGVRKVLGASVAGIVGLLSKDFLSLVILSLAIASPVAWYFMKNWLSDFAYHIEIEWWMFALTAATAVVIAFVTVSFQSIKAALANPVKSLRSE